MDNPVRFIDPDGMGVYSPIYGTNGKFLGTDSEGFKGDILIMREAVYNKLSDNGKKTIDHEVAVDKKNSITLGEAIDNFSSYKGMTQKSRNAYVGVVNTIINDVVSRTSGIKGFEPNKLFGGMVSSVYDDYDKNPTTRRYGVANEGTTRVAFALSNKQDKKLTFQLYQWADHEILGRYAKPTVDNLQNTYIHEAGGHIYHQFKKHYEVVNFQMKHPTFKNLTPLYKQHLNELYIEYKEKGE